MSGPYPQQGYPQQPAQGGWGGQVGGGPSGPYGQSSYPGGWQQQPQQQPPRQQFPSQPPPDQPGWHGQEPEPTPPPRKRNTGQIVIAVIASLVIIGGVVAGIVLLNNNHAQQQANPGTTAPTPTATATSQQSGNQPGATNASGSTTLSVTAGQCVSATTTANGSAYAVTKTVNCGTVASDFVLNKTVSQISGCAAQQYVVITGPSSTVYCFTIDAKAGDCVSNYYLKVACGTNAAFTVLKVEPGPGSNTSCHDVSGAQRWVPAGYPAQVACIAPPSSS